MEQKTCLCGSNISSNACCTLIIRGIRAATTPEQLMCSRYTAFCLRNINYLTDTYHFSTCERDYKANLHANIDGTHWLGLKVIQSGVNTKDSNKGFVEFIAYYTDATNTLSHVRNEDVKQLHEYSFFLKEEDRWFYLEGKRLPPVKFQRNDLCWCKSGKKIKKCHG